VTVELGAGRSLIIEGQLLARGTAEEPILFTDRSSAQGIEHWGSVLFRDSAVDAQYAEIDDYLEGSVLQWCIFEHARRAVQLHGASPHIEHCTFRENETEASVDAAGGAAICMDGGAAPRILECSFEDNTATAFGKGGAIYASDSDPIIQDNEFIGNWGSYGGALSNDLMASPIVGNLFEDNETNSKGGAVSLISSASALLNNQIVGNRADSDGGGVHVCVDCYPHANPLFMDNTITDNSTSSQHADEAAAGVGAAYLRVMAHNNIHDNLRRSAPSDFGWFHELDEGYPDWVANPSIAQNWWGTTDEEIVAQTVFDGSDDDAFGIVSYQPVLDEPVAAAMPRVTITNRKIRYLDADDPMPVFVTIYNPGPERSVELVVVLQYGEGAKLLYQGELDFPDAAAGRGVYALELPENSAFFTELLAPPFPGQAAMGHGTWHAAMFDPTDGERLGEVCSARFELGEDGGSNGPPLVPEVGVSIGGNELAVGDGAAALLDRFGEPSRLGDLGAVGTLFAYDSLDLAGLLSGDGEQATVTAIYLLSGATGQTLSGVAIGSDEATVSSALGPPESEPYLDAWWYPTDGLAVEWQDGAVSRVHVF